MEDENETGSESENDSMSVDRVDVKMDEGEETKGETGVGVLIYGVEDRPSIPMAILFGLQVSARPSSHPSQRRWDTTWFGLC